MDHAITTIDNFARRAQDRLMKLERDMDQDQDVIAYRAVMAHDPDTLAEIDSTVNAVRRLQRAEDDVAAGKVLDAETRRWIEQVRRRFYGEGSDSARKHAARCSAILVGIHKNAHPVSTKSTVTGKEIKEMLTDMDRQDRRYRARKRNAAIKTFAVRSVIVVGVGTVVTAGALLLSVGLAYACVGWAHSGRRY